MAKLEVHDILEENVTCGVGENTTSYRGTEKKAVYFAGTQVRRKSQNTSQSNLRKKTETHTFYAGDLCW